MWGSSNVHAFQYHSCSQNTRKSVNGAQMCQKFPGKFCVIRPRNPRNPTQHPPPKTCEGRLTTTCVACSCGMLILVANTWVFLQPVRWICSNAAIQKRYRDSCPAPNQELALDPLACRPLLILLPEPSGSGMVAEFWVLILGGFPSKCASLLFGTFCKFAHKVRTQSENLGQPASVT